MTLDVIGAPATWALRSYARSGLLLVLVLGLAVIVVVPPLVLGPSLRLEPLPHDDWGVAWSSLALTPDAARTEALTRLVGVLTTSTIGVLAVGLLTLFAISIARAFQRRPEVVVRRAVGASRRMLRRAALGEGLVLALTGLVGGAIGVVAIASLMAVEWPAARAPILLGMAPLPAVALAACVVFGALLPLVFVRPRAPGAAVRASALPPLVPAVQLGLGLLGVIASAQLAQRAPSSGRAIAQSASGIVFPLTVRDSSRATRAHKYAALLAGFDRDPRSAVVSLTSPGTLIGLGTVDYITTECGRCFDGGLPKPLHVVRATSHLASADTFQAMRMNVIAGRGLADSDHWGGAPVAVVSRSLAERDFEGGRAVGRRVRVGAPDALYTVVGIVEDGRFEGIGASAQPRPRVYLSSLQHPAGQLELLVRPGSRRSSPDSLGAFARSVLGATAVGGPRWEREVLDHEAATARWFTLALRVVGWGGIIIGALGMLAVMRLWVQAELPEIALRRALGARRRHVLGRVALRAIAVVAGGMAIAWWLEPLLSDVLRSSVPAVPAGGLSLVPVPLVLLFAATVLGALGPAWMTARSTPATLLGFGDL